MKIQFLSDTHDFTGYEINQDADIVIHGGDAGNSGAKSLLLFSERCKDLGKDFLVVPGNHDLYHHNIQDVYEYFDKYNINYLNHDKVYIKDGITFVGGTLFSNFRSNRVEPHIADKYKLACHFFADFRTIYYDGCIITQEDYVTLFNKTYNNINNYRGKEDVVVVTHFPPSPKGVHPKYAETADSLSGYFSNDLDLTGFSTWLFGHTHYNTDTLIDGCRFVSNAVGHLGEDLGNEYNPTLLIEV